MTIAIVLKIGDGLVFGADSASTLSNGNTFVNSYFNAEKVFNVVKGLPLGAVTAGLGGLAGRSVMSLAKGWRRSPDEEPPDPNSGRANTNPEPTFVPLSEESQGCIIRTAEEFRRAGRPMHPPPPTPVGPTR